MSSCAHLQVEQEEWERVQTLYERLLERTHHVKVWISYARCQHAAPPPEEGPAQARAVFQRANRSLRSCQEKEQRLMLLEAWRDFEDEFGDDISLGKVKHLLPRKVTRRRQVAADDGSKMRWEEYVDFVFPDDETAKPSLLLLAKAKEWAKQQRQQEQQEINTPPHEDNDSAMPQPHTDQHQDQDLEEEQEPDRDLDRDDSEVDVGSSSDSSSSDSEDDKKRTKRKRRRKSDSSSSSSKEEEEERQKNGEGRKSRGKKQQKEDTSSMSSSEEGDSSSENQRKKAKDFFA